MLNPRTSLAGAMLAVAAGLLVSAGPAAAQLPSGAFSSGGFSPGFSAGYPQFYGPYGFGLYPGYVGGRYSIRSMLDRGGLSGYSPYYGYDLGYYPYFSPLDYGWAGGWSATEDWIAHTGRVQITVQVPAGAEVWVEGAKTQQTGAVRHFESPRLEAGQKYRYTIRARWKEDGRTKDETRQVPVYAGDRVTVDFTERMKDEG
jgi:uncharacterized protein (TIGR03000 family)